MSLHNIKNTIYFGSENRKEDQKEKEKLSEEQKQKLFESLAKHTLKEKKPEFDELEGILQNSLSEEDNQKSEQEQNKNYEESMGSRPLTTILQDMGYLKEDKNWLTRKGFYEIGKKILNDIMKDLSSSETGLHETVYSGEGNVTIDNTKMFERGSDVKLLSVPKTILNSVKRVSKNNQKIQFPLDIEPEDLEQYETLDDVRAAVVYCIDLSSTMKYSLGEKGKSRIEAAKKALWSLYLLNKKFFPTDSIYVVGFASMASLVNPYDIPYLKTYDVNDNFLHYTNYQAAFRLARKILHKTTAQNKRLVMITDGQPSACFVENENQKNEIISEKPYSNFYSPDPQILDKVKKEKNLKLESSPGRLVYLCYRYKKVDPKIQLRTMMEAKKCKREAIQIDSVVISDEPELFTYIKDFEKELKGKTFHIENQNMDRILVNDFLKNTKRFLWSRNSW
ncbi:MAG: VWA domain-containing protein [Nitrosopumilaceae archaeon]|nr:VWA domain-containing protein [Nitrosopumilaceae archaeon]NIU00511.1 VWA domain-containing protein [Nitrosopumilaceae archaeon]NIU86894.1 VWA domain-containing protein [Nitrosopumilaceae archaeon]NIV65574.1 VWA domain-containing protein [Nitrosopumilaceae archaeon]NIX61113.1 VWA domain-containing protein [Nitrosopumilaceae archaeon]